MQGQPLFSASARAVRRHHVARAAEADRWLLARMWDELAFRASEALPSARDILILGHDFGALPVAAWPEGSFTRCDPGAQPGWGADIIRCDEDQLPFASASFDLILACGTLDSLHDVPGALLLARRLLRPEGRFFGAMLGGGSLSLLRQIVYGEGDLAVARLHPQIDVRAAGDLLARAGFAQPVADMDSVTARYSNWGCYLGDLRANGIGNCFTERHTLPRAKLSEWQRRFATACGEDGKASEEFCPHYFTGLAG